MARVIIKDMDLELSIGADLDDFINGVETARINRVPIGKFKTEPELIFLINKYLFKTNLTNGKFI